MSPVDRMVNSRLSDHAMTRITSATLDARANNIVHAPFHFGSGGTDPRNPRTFRDDSDEEEQSGSPVVGIPGVVSHFHRRPPADRMSPWCSRWTNVGLVPKQGFSPWRVPRLQPMLWYRMHEFNVDGTVRSGELLVVGPFGRMVRVPDSIRRDHLIVFMRAGTHLGTLGVSGSTLANRRVRASELWGSAGRELEERLASATCNAERLRLMHGSVQLGFQRQATATEAEVVKGLQAFLTQTTVGEVAAMTGWSSRHLQRLFLDHVGVSPKHASLLLRSGDALSRGLGADRPDWARIALDHAFADQAHLTRTVATYFGTPPGRLHRTVRGQGHWLDGLVFLPDNPTVSADHQ